MDALALRVREGGRIVSAAALIAVGVNRDGRREILGLDVVTVEGRHGLDELLARPGRVA
jgi:transposase-like protein